MLSSQDSVQSPQEYYCEKPGCLDIGLKWCEACGAKVCYGHFQRSLGVCVDCVMGEDVDMNREAEEKGE